uniref:Divalent cation transporter n=1 Tax=Syphacia muris TaxID=451379 RepID=A0A0N5AT29_9BILA
DIAHIHNTEADSQVLNEEKIQNNQEIVKDSVLKLTKIGDALYSKSSVETAKSENDGDANFILQNLPTESSYILFFQVLFPFMVGGLGMVMAGFVLDKVQQWDFFVQVRESFILVPALLGLKGNLEMTLASRLSTQANLGRIDSATARWKVVTSNFALIQVQAIVVAFFASAFAMVLAWIPKGQIDWAHAAVLCASSLATASVASLLLSCIMVGVIVFSRFLNINPDNVATPIAASLGDLTTLGVLFKGTAFLRAHLTESWLNVATIIIFLLSSPFFAFVACRDEGAKSVLYNGWSPVIFSMLISSAGGFVLKTAIERYSEVAAFQPVINGVGGNLAAVQASRMGTFLHQNASLGVLPLDWTLSRFYGFRRAFFSSDPDSRSARVLLVFVVPGHIFFNWIIRVLHGDQSSSGALFTSLYLLAALTQVVLLLYLCQWLIPLMWSLSVDPDNAAIPYLTAAGDFMGSLLLFITFLSIDMLSSSRFSS